jgi:hypothetical protein
MKRVVHVIFWIFSGALLFMALALLSQSALTCAMLIGCAVLINPLFHEKVPLKKGLTAVLAIGLFIAAVAVYPVNETTEAIQQPEPTIAEKIGSSEEAPTTRTLQEAPAEMTEPAHKEVITAVPTKQNTPSPKPTITPTPKPTATPRPTATPTLKPTPTSEPASKVSPAARSTGITILDYSDTVSRGDNAFIKIQGAPNTDYDCEVEYKTTMSNASGIGVKRSDSDGIVFWRWKVGTRTSLDYSPTIYIDGGGDSISVQFEVTK